MIHSVLSRVLAQGLLRASSAGAFYWLISTVTVQGCTYAAQLILGRTLDPAQYSDIRIAEANLSVFLLVASLGIPAATARFAAASDESEGRRFLGMALGMTVATSLLSGAAFVGLAFAWGSSSASDLGACMTLLAPTLIAGAVSRVILSYHQGVLRLRRIAILTVLPAMALIPMMYLAVDRWGVRGWCYARLLSEFLLVGIAVATIPRPWAFNFDRSIARKLLTFGGFALGALLVDRASTTLDVSVLRFWQTDAANVAAYGACTLLAVLITLPSGAINVVGLSDLARVHSDPARLRSYFFSLVTASLFVTLGTALAFGFAGRRVLQWLFPGNYPISDTVVWILAGSELLRSAAQSVGALAMAVDKSQFCLYSNLGAMATLVAAAALLVPTHGQTGAVLAHGAASVVRLALLGGIVGLLLKSGRPVEAGGGGAA